MNEWSGRIEVRTKYCKTPNHHLNGAGDCLEEETGLRCDLYEQLGEVVEQCFGHTLVVERSRGGCRMTYFKSPGKEGNHRLSDLSKVTSWVELN